MRPLHRLHPLLLSELGVVMRKRVGTASSCMRLLHKIILHLTGHGVRTKLAALRHDVRVAWLPRPQTLFGVVERLPCGLGVGVPWALLAGYNGRVVEQVDELACLGREQDLLLSALNDGCGVNVVGLFELLTRDVGELGFGDERLGFGADKLLFERDELGRFRLFVLELLNLVLDLCVTLLAYGPVSLSGPPKSVPSVCVYDWAAPSSPCFESASARYGCPPVPGQTSPPAQQSPPATHQACR